MLKPITNMVNAQIPIMCRLAFTFKKSKINAIIVLINPAAKKKYKAGI